MKNIKKYHYIVFVYFIFILSILFIFGHTPTNDSLGYIEYAQICLSQGQPYPCNTLIYGHPFIWNIGSINIIALSLKIFNSYYPVLLLMCLLKSLTALLVFKIAHYLFNEKTAYISLYIFVLYPNNWGQSTTLMSEIPMIFLSLSALYIAIASKNNKYVFLAGIIFAFANWFRPLAIIFIFILIIYFIINNKYTIKKIPLLIAGYLFMISIFGLETYNRTGHFIYQSEASWYNIVIKARDNASARTVYHESDKNNPRNIKGMEHLTCFQCNDIWKKQSIKWLKQHPFQYLQQLPVRLIELYYSDYDNMVAFASNKSIVEKLNITIPYRHIYKEFFNLNYLQYISIGNLIIYYFIMICFILSIAYTIKNKYFMMTFIPLSIFFIGTFATILVVQGESRYKDPFMPFIMIMAAYYISNCHINMKKIK